MEQIRTLADLVHRLGRHGERDALVDLGGHRARSLSFETLAARTEERAHALRARGSRGPIALLAPAGAESVVAMLAALRAGALLCPVDAQLRGSALRHVLRDAAPSLLVADREHADRVANLDLEDPPPGLRLEEIEEERASPGEREPRADSGPEPSEAALLLYTSGTTGAPKGVPLSHERITWQLDRVRELGLIAPGDRVLLSLPLHHVYPLVIGLLAPLSLGVSVVLPGALTGPSIRRALARGDSTVAVAVPRLYAALDSGLQRKLASRGRLRAALTRGALRGVTALRRRTGLRAGRVLLRPAQRALGGGSLRLVVSGGAALEPELAWRLEGLGLRVATGYGLTETAPLISVNAPGDARFETAGRTLPGVDVRIGPPDPDAPREDGESGEIQVRGPGVFQGYRGLPEKTAEAFDGDWFRTGDLGRIESDGFLRVEGRTATRIVTASGETLQAERLEDAYSEHPWIRELAVCEESGALTALVVPDARALRDAEVEDAERGAREAVHERGRELPSPQRVRDVVVTRDALPRTLLGKLRRHALQERLERARAGEDGGVETRAPLSPEDMGEEDRARLEDPRARAAWDELCARFPEGGLTLDSDLRADLRIDSLDWLDLGLVIEERAGIELREEALERIESVRDLLDEVSGAERSEGAGDGADPVAAPERFLGDEAERWLAPLGAPARALAHALASGERALLRALFGLETHGRDALRLSPPFVLAPNHSSYLDPFALTAALPPSLLRETWFAAWTGAALANPLFRGFSRLAQAIPVDPRRGAASSLAFASVVLQRKGALVWFPEGMRSTTGELQELRPGLGRLLHQHDVPVIPVWIEGAHRVLPPGRAWPRRGQIRVAFGEPVRRDALLGPREGDESDAQRITRGLRERLAELADRCHSSEEEGD